MKCLQCGHENPMDASFCENCGAQLGPALRYQWKRLSRKSVVGLGILMVGIGVEVQAMTSDSVNWWMLMIGGALVYVGIWGAYWGFSKSYMRMDFRRLKNRIGGRGS